MLIEKRFLAYSFKNRSCSYPSADGGGLVTSEVSYAAFHCRGSVWRPGQRYRNGYGGAGTVTGVRWRQQADIPGYGRLFREGLLVITLS